MALRALPKWLCTTTKATVSGNTNLIAEFNASALTGHGDFCIRSSIRRAGKGGVVNRLRPPVVWGITVQAGISSDRRRVIDFILPRWRSIWMRG
jgi:hypothetical protein